MCRWPLNSNKYEMTLVAWNFRWYKYEELLELFDYVTAYIPKDLLLNVLKALEERVKARKK